MRDSGKPSPVLAQLRRRMAGIERRHRLGHGAGHQRGTGCEAAAAYAPTGHEAIDAALGGGIARARLHELFAADGDDAASAGGFAAMLAVRLGGPLLWLREDRAQRAGGGLFAPGLADIGFDPAQLLMLVLPDPLAVLRAAAEALRCAALGAVVIELWGAAPVLDLTASRRLALAAGESGVTALMLRVDAAPVPSAAWTRWQVAAAPSLALEASAPGHPTMRLDVLRQRGRHDGGRWHVEWNRDQNCLREASAAPFLTPGRDGGAVQRPATPAALSGAVVPFAADGAAARRVA